MHTRRPSSVFEHFRAFWSEVEPLRQSALSPAMAPPAEGETTGALVHAPMSARDRLLSVLRAQDAEVSRWAKGPVLDHYREAQRRFGVGWPVLAAVNFVESAFGRLRSESVAGARGPMQFIPSTWEAYGMGGDVRDPHDAIIGAANYLHASGAPGDYQRALYAYNPSPAYVAAVLGYARQIRRDPRAYFAYHSWQVFVRTPSGVQRITGPPPLG